MLGRMHAAAMHGLYGYLEWMAAQIMADTAESLFLDRQAGIWGVLRLPAAFAEGAIAVVGTTGAVVPAGTQMQRADGTAYVSTADATLASGTATVLVAATEAGASGNAAVSTALSLVAPVAGVSGAAVVAAGGLAGGADAETDDALRLRLIARIQQAPMGGAAADYVAWALQVPGVTRAWVYPLEDGVGTVKVRFMRDNDASSIPDSTEVAAVQAYINERRPVTAQVTVAAPTAAALNLSIALTPDTVAVRTAVQAEVADLLRREARPGGTVLLSHIREAISVAAGETNHVLLSPVADVVAATGAISTVGTFTWS